LWVPVPPGACSPSGCADEHTRVVLLEAGGQDSNSIPEIRVSSLFTRTFGSEVDRG
jgi:hypothetical protein